MQSNNYHSAKAENGRLGGLAKAKNNAFRVEKERLENTEKVLLLALKQPAMKQADIAENTGVAQSFVSGVLTLKVKILRLEILAKEKKLKGITLKPGRPFKLMLALPAENAEKTFLMVCSD